MVRLRGEGPQELKYIEVDNSGISRHYPAGITPSHDAHERRRDTMTPTSGATKAKRRRRIVDFLRRKLPSQVGRYLEGVEFPARKEDLVGRLERNGIPSPILGQLRKRLPEREYRSPKDVLGALRRGGR